MLFSGLDLSDKNKIVAIPVIITIGCLTTQQFFFVLVLSGMVNKLRKICSDLESYLITVGTSSFACTRVLDTQAEEIAPPNVAKIIRRVCISG